MTFGRKNYILLGISALLILLGFILMSGGGSGDLNTFNPQIFSKVRIVLAPMVTLAGFLLIIYAILANPKKSEKAETTTEQNK